MIGATKSKMSGAAKARHARNTEVRRTAQRRVAARRKAVENRDEERSTLRKKFAAFFESLRETFAPGNLMIASDRAYEVHEEGSWRRRHDLIVKGGKIVGQRKAAA